jgi:NarL family two-component system response regulator LiaR
MVDDIQVLIADDHAVVREGLRSLITSEPGMTVIDEAKDGIEALDKSCALQPDVLLLDLVMPRLSGLEVIATLAKREAEIPILVLTSFAEDDKVFTAIKTGALGYLLKDSTPEELLDAIRAVYQGETSLHPAIARKLVVELSQPTELPPAGEELSAREVEVLKLIAHGLSNQEIGDKLFITEGTVRTHVSNILGKLHLANRTQAALYALREGLANLDD